MCLPSRNGAFDAIKSRMACSALLPCALRAAPRRRGFSSAVGSALGVRCGAVEWVELTQPPNFRLQIKLVILSVPTNSPQCVRYNRVRGNSAEHATDGPKSRKLHQCEHVQSRHVSPPNPRIKSQNPKGGFGTGAPPKPNEVGLVGRGGAAERLSFCPERQNEGCGACDDEARLSPLSFFKQRKMVPPKGLPKRECP